MAGAEYGYDGDGVVVGADQFPQTPVVQPTRPLQERAVEPQRGSFLEGFDRRRSDEGGTVQPHKSRRSERASSSRPSSGGRPLPAFQDGSYPAPEGNPRSVSARPIAAPQSARPASNGSGLAFLSLIFGVFAIATCFLSPATGILLGIVAIWLAGAHLKRGGRLGVARTGRICGIVAIVLSLIGFAFASLSGLSSLSSAFDDLLNGDPIGASSSFNVDAGVITSDEEQKAVDVVMPRFEQLKTGDEEMAAQVGAVANKGFTQLTGYSMQECGVDLAEYGAAAMEGFSYEIVLVSAYESSEDGFVSADVSSKDVYEIGYAFADALGTYVESPEGASATEDERKAKMGELLMQAVQGAPLYPDQYCSVDLLHEGAEWVIDEDSWDTEMEYLFSLA